MPPILTVANSLPILCRLLYPFLLRHRIVASAGAHQPKFTGQQRQSSSSFSADSGRHRIGAAIRRRYKYPRPSLHSGRRRTDAATTASLCSSSSCQPLFAQFRKSQFFARFRFLYRRKCWCWCSSTLSGGYFLFKISLLCQWHPFELLWCARHGDQS